MMRAAWTAAALLSHWRRHPMQLAALLIGLASATALWSGVQAINQQARHSYDRAAAAFGGARAPALIGRHAPTFPQQLFVDLRRAGWSVSPVLEGRVQLAGRSFRLMGIDPLTFPAEIGNAPAIGKEAFASFVSPPGETLLAPETLADLHLAEGARPIASSGARLPPLRLQRELVPDLLVVDIGIAQQLLDAPDRLSRLLIGRDNGPRQSLESVVGDELRTVEAHDESELERLTDSFHLNLTAFGLLSFVVGLFIVNSAIGLAYEQRLPMLRTLRACGVSTRLLNAVLVAELLALALTAGIVGMVAGYLIAFALLPNVAATLRGLYGAPIAGQLTLAPSWWIAGLVISVAGALVAASAGLAKSFRQPVLSIAQPQAWRKAQQRWLFWQGGVALAMFAVAAALAWVGDSLVSGFALLAMLLLGAALGLPLILNGLLAIGQHMARRPLAVWFFADSRQQSSGLSLALMALLMALAVNIGVGTMVESFSRTFSIWLDGRLAADLYIQAPDNATARRIQAWLRQRSDVQAILPRGEAETRIAGLPVEIVGLPDDATFRDRWPLLRSAERAWIRLRPGNAAFVSEQLARRLKLEIGNAIDIPAPAGNWKVEIAGIYADYGNPRGQITVNFAALTRWFPALPLTRMGLRTSQGEIPALMAALQREFGLDPRQVIDQASLKAESKRIFERTFAVTAALNSLTLGIAGIALLMSLLTLGHSRLPQLAPLWAIGLTRRRLATIELGKMLALALFTAVIAIPVGLMVAWCLLEVVNVKAFGWRLPFQVFPLQLLRLLLVAIAASLLAALWPAIRLSRMQPAMLVQVFSHER